MTNAALCFGLLALIACSRCRAWPSAMACKACPAGAPAHLPCMLYLTVPAAAHGSSGLQTSAAMSMSLRAASS